VQVYYSASAPKNHLGWLNLQSPTLAIARSCHKQSGRIPGDQSKTKWAKLAHVCISGRFRGGLSWLRLPPRFGRSTKAVTVLLIC